MAKQKNVLPGFNLTLGYTLLYLSLIVLIPLSAAFIKTTELSFDEFWSVVTAPRVVASYKLTFGASLLGALINAVFGLLTAWVLVRYTFPGKKIIDALVDLPFALPTAVAGIALTAVYAGNGWIGSLLEPHGIKVAFTPVGVVIALTFIGLPFVSEITPLIIITKLEQYEYSSATAIAVVMLIISFLLLFAINGLQWWSTRRNGSSH